MNRVRVQIQRLPEGRGLPLPHYMSEHASGMDLSCADEEVAILPGGSVLVSTGFAIAVPPGYEAQIRPRSGLAAKKGLTVLNAPGTVDADYRGPVKVILMNLGPEPVTLSRGDRIAQMVIAPVVQAEWEEVDDLPDTERGEGGFGHTGR
jgi:dUTP pyrophosphatase